LSPLLTPCPNECRVKKRIVCLKEFVHSHVQLFADLGENVDEMLAQHTTKNGVEVVWCHLAVNVVPDFVVVVPFPEPWLYEKKVYVLWAGCMPHNRALRPRRTPYTRQHKMTRHLNTVTSCEHS
jgi:hypothetical protein